ncbi:MULTISPECIES: AzlD domain-containing protein [unclassified Halomonas]|uniref:AzlD domain-containing protein n=1 Tax=unclassified Halomonas TaxID=2609666 RepID=UPI00209D60FD|nr:MULTISPECIES: AzlD domain-containing protein [unclassified Halomonas]MCP1314612.1 AzlD domain-containing protein [Halomonas sp. 707D7]MCP1325735.1 AzlD domain-containing protein [Halomonas sp. 707D4]
MNTPTVWSSLAAITIMVLIGYGSRVLGLIVMTRLTLGPNVRLFIDAMSSSVLIAILTPMIVNGDHATRVAALAAGLVAVALKSPLASITVGILCASLWRWLS